MLGATKQGDGYLHGNGYVVTWAIGHLAALAQPHEINPDWRQWRRDTLPMLPKQWPLVVYEKTKDQFEAVRADPRQALTAIDRRGDAEAGSLQPDRHDLADRRVVLDQQQALVHSAPFFGSCLTARTASSVRNGTASLGM